MGGIQSVLGPTFPAALTFSQRSNICDTPAKAGHDPLRAQRARIGGSGADGWTEAEMPRRETSKPKPFCAAPVPEPAPVVPHAATSAPRPGWVRLTRVLLVVLVGTLGILSMLLGP